MGWVFISSRSRSSTPHPQWTCSTILNPPCPTDPAPAELVHKVSAEPSAVDWAAHLPAVCMFARRSAAPSRPSSALHRPETTYLRVEDNTIECGRRSGGGNAGVTGGIEFTAGLEADAAALLWPWTIMHVLFWGLGFLLFPDILNVAASTGRLSFNSNTGNVWQLGNSSDFGVFSATAENEWVLGHMTLQRRCQLAAVPQSCCLSKLKKKRVFNQY